jgi:L,D-peptidoglycan transpeptidase YkuD (ErfK/YbiS/YcfS/YnhG family)
LKRPARPVNRTVALIHVRSLCAAHQDGLLVAGNLRIPCKLGRTGRRALKREGDGATPSGLWPMRRIQARRDSWGWIRTGLPFCFTAPDDGWCDDPADRNYNRPVKLPYRASHEHMWRKDHLYDVVVILGHNDRSRVKGAGSAVFLHLPIPKAAQPRAVLRFRPRTCARCLHCAGARPGSRSGRSTISRANVRQSSYAVARIWRSRPAHASRRSGWRSRNQRSSPCSAP